MTEPQTSSAKPFVIVAGATALFWATAGVWACHAFSSQAALARGNTKWFLGLWGLSLLNLLALGMTVREVVGLVAERASNGRKNRLIRAVRAFSWGTLKLLCLGIFVAVLVCDREVSVMVRLLGSGTLLVVPLVGGLGAVKYA